MLEKSAMKKADDDVALSSMISIWQLGHRAERVKYVIWGLEEFIAVQI